VDQQQKRGDRTSTHGHLSKILTVDYLTFHAYKNCHLPLFIVIPNTPLFIHTRTTFFFYLYLHQLYFTSLPLQSSYFPQSHPRLSTTLDYVSTQNSLIINFQCLNQPLNPGQALKPRLKVTGTHSLQYHFLTVVSGLLLPS
jgi:hypothetical protein